MFINDKFNNSFLTLPFGVKFSGIPKVDGLNEYVVRPFKNNFVSSPVNVTLSHSQKAIIKTLIYFGIFDYPLDIKEIERFSSLELMEVEADLEFLCKQNLVKGIAGYYFLGEDQGVVDQRIIRNANASKYLPLAKKYSRWISKIPFVRCVCISGSLSKNDMGKNADIDYFVIVQSDRVWIMRLIFSLMIKPLTILGMRNKYLCPNYIIDENHLEIRDKNLYTAIEIVTLIPVGGSLNYQWFMDANAWVKLILPKGIYIPDIKQDSLSKRNSFWKSNFFTSLDNAIFRLYKWHYKRKFYDSGKWKIEDFELKFNKFESKNHLNGYRNKILTKHDEGIARFEQNFAVTLT